MNFGDMKFYGKEAGKRLRAVRKQCGKTQQEVAEELNHSKETISKTEQGKRGMSIEFLMELANYYDVSMDYILRGKNEGSNLIDKKLSKVPEEKREQAVKAVLALLDAFC